ncbi:MAG: hypothetical protein HY919_07130 [Elusimicrobia bacterium]|nr:hypothetical protein [Elusimicrobiota bacterium]
MKKYFLILTFNLLPLTCLYAGSSTTYTTANQFNAGTKEDTIVFGTGDGDGYVNLTNNFYDITNPPKPSARRWSAAVYNSTKDKIILFGGFDSNPLNDTWIYNPQTEQWTQKSPSTIPSPRYGHIMVSSGTSKAILFGGWNGADYFNDTWEYDFDTDNWTEIATVSSPTAMAYSCADYDSINNKIILFGGQFSGGTKSSETWVYNISGSSWTKGGYGPAARLGAAGCYEPENKKFLIFGGEGTSYLNDTWSYDYNSNLWSNKTPSANPSARTEAGACYDSRNKRTVLFGGRDSSGNKNDIWFYDYAVNKWSNSQPSQTASARCGFTMNYISTIQKAFLFGGFDNSGAQNDFYNYVFRSSGVFTTVQYDTPFSTELYWQSVEAPTQSGIPANTTLKFQVASSADNSTYSQFADQYDNPDGYSIYSGNPFSISSSHNNKRYLKLKFFFDTTEPPLSGTLHSATVHFNRSPSRPSLSSPSNNFSTSDTTPDFNWYAVSDDDGDSVSYKIEIDDNAFEPRVITSSNIYTTSYSTTTILSHGKYSWWVFGWDGANYSLCSSTYTLYIDTFPPAAITSFSASIGSYNGAINLLWTAPENTGSIGNILAGKYFIRCATYAFLAETDWQNNSVGEKTVSKAVITPGENQTFTFDGLLDATTYYFSVKTQDAVGNVSAISSTSPFCITNAAPQVIVKSPNGSEVFSDNRIISWEYSDPYPLNDTHTFSIYDSSDGVNFNLLASNLPNGTTYYLWNTKNVRNSSLHKIKIVVTDVRGLSGFDTSDNYFTVDNPNIAPVVSLIAPNGAEKITGSYTISFSVTDQNLADTHKFTILASTTSGYSYDIKIAENLTEIGYIWNTALFPNSPKYRIKILATDDGVPNITSEDFSESDFEVNNNNKTPSSPVLVSPLNDSYNTIAVLKFVWQKSVDPNPEDFLTYTLYYSTNGYFIGANVVSGITDTEYAPANLTENIKYYWKVAAVDPFGNSAISDPFNFIASWSKDDSDDGKVRVDIIDQLPPGYYVKVENTDADFSAAVKNSVSDRLIKCINQSVYKITVYDKNNVSQNISVKGSVRFNYVDENADGYVDGTDIKIENIRIANLNETKNLWEFPRATQIIDKTKKYVKVDAEHFSYFTMVASVVPTKKVSNIVNYPNPFNPDKEITTIRYVLTESDDVLVRIFNLVGDLVYQQKIDAGEEGAIGQPEGKTNEITWNGENGNGIVVANGVYILEIKSAEDKEIRKIAVIK